jgi:hypothetical protein
MIPKAVIKPFNLINRTSDFNRMDMELYKQYGKNWLEIDEDIIYNNSYFSVKQNEYLQMVENVLSNENNISYDGEKFSN